MTEVCSTGLSDRQKSLLAAWLAGAVVEHDHSWGLVETRVLRLRWRGERFIVKAAPAGDRHLARELTAHRQWLEPWRGVAPELVFADEDAALLVTRFVPGELVLGSDVADSTEVFRQAGALLVRLHEQRGVPEQSGVHGAAGIRAARVQDDEYEERADATLLRKLGARHRIAGDVVATIRRHVEGWPRQPVNLVPTHGDWQPRNWLWNGEEVVPIDFGRAALRPSMTDWTRIAVQDFSRRLELEAAFIDGYGSDPREPGPWAREQLREAVATAVWAYEVGAEAFEAQGHRMIERVLELVAASE